MKIKTPCTYAPTCYVSNYEYNVGIYDNDKNLIAVIVDQPDRNNAFKVAEYLVGLINKGEENK